MPQGPAYGHVSAEQQVGQPSGPVWRGAHHERRRHGHYASALLFAATAGSVACCRASLAPLVRIITVRQAVAALRDGQGHGRRDAHEAGAEGADAGGTRARGDSARRQKHRQLGSRGGSTAGASALAQTAGCSSGGGDGDGEGEASTAGGGYCLPVDRLVLLRDNGMPDTLRKAEAGGRLDASRAHTLRKKFK